MKIKRKSMLYRVGLIIILAIQTLSSKADVNCYVGVYPPYSGTKERECKSVSCIPWEGKDPSCLTMATCYNAASNKSNFGEPGSPKDPPQKWELFYKNYNGGFNQTCEQWKDSCKTCGSQASKKKNKSR